MRKIWIVLVFVTMCGFSAAFGQLRVANNFGQDLKIAINGEKNDVPYKGIKSFPIRGQKSVYLECVTLNGKVKFSVSKEVGRSGLVTVEPDDNTVVTQSSSSSVVSIVTSTTNASPPPATGNSTLQSILKGNGPQTSQSSVTKTVTEVRQTNLPVTQTVTVVQPQSQANFESIKVIYTGTERFKVFSDLGGGQWQGIEFRGRSKADSLQDNAKNEYSLSIQKDRDIHIGVVFNPEDAINIYGEFRKRVNRGDAILYINEGDIKKMSTNETKEIKIKFMAKDYKLLFDPKDVSKDGKSTLISIGYDQSSRRFMAPIGQFYLKASCTNTSNGMFYPTVYIPIHVISSDNTIIITTEQIQKATAGADLNLKWSNLQ